MPSNISCRRSYHHHHGMRAEGQKRGPFSNESAAHNLVFHMIIYFAALLPFGTIQSEMPLTTLSAVQALDSTCSYKYGESLHYTLQPRGYLRDLTPFPMAPLLSVLLFLLGLLLFPATMAHNVIYSSPLQILYGGETLKDGNMTLGLGHNCSLVLYEGHEIVWDARTTLPTSHCALIMQNNGEILLFPDEETIQPAKVGTLSYDDRWALLLANGKLGIYGPALWSNGIAYPNPHPRISSTHQPFTALERTTASEGVALPLFPNHILFSGSVINGHKNGNVELVSYGNFSAFLTSKCTLAVVLGGKWPWTAWETDVDRNITGQCQLELKSDGEVFIGDHVAYNNGTEVTFKVWSSGYTSKPGDYFMALRFTGELVVFGASQWLYNGKETNTEKIKMVIMH